MEGQSPVPALGTAFPDDAQLYAPPPPPSSLSLPTYFQFKGTAISEQISLRHKLRCVHWVAGVPKDSCAAGQRARKARGQWEAPGVPL